MAKKKSAKGGLGKGLDLLIPVDEPKKEDEKKETILLKTSQLEPNKNQPRKKFDEEKIEELAASIKQYGIIQPIVVIKKDDYYQIIAGERRWRAAKKAGLKEVPVVLKEYTEKEIKTALNEIREKYSGDSGIILIEFNNTFQFQG